MFCWKISSIHLPWLTLNGTKRSTTCRSNIFTTKCKYIPQLLRLGCRLLRKKLPSMEPRANICQRTTSQNLCLCSVSQEILCFMTAVSQNVCKCLILQSRKEKRHTRFERRKESRKKFFRALISHANAKLDNHKTKRAVFRFNKCAHSHANCWFKY